MIHSSDLIAQINALAKTEYRDKKLGLTRVRNVLKALGNPQNQYPVIHIAGTNGKGSTAAMIYTMLQAAGHKVGLYTSPHLLDCRERIRINDTLIPENILVELLILIEKTIGGNKLTYFEIITVAAFCYFQREKIDVLVLEVGLGGRLDATNVVRNKLLSIITAIDTDHTEVLGKSLAKIASEKAGIIQHRIPVIAATGHRTADLVIGAICKKRNAPLFMLGRDFKVQMGNTDWIKKLQTFNYEGIVETGLKPVSTFNYEGIVETGLKPVSTFNYEGIVERGLKPVSTFNYEGIVETGLKPVSTFNYAGIVETGLKPVSTFNYEGIVETGLKPVSTLVKLSLLGAHQVRNAGLALAATEILLGKARFKPVFLKALTKVNWFGRFTITSCTIAGEQRQIIFDGAHNVAGITALCDTLRSFLIFHQNIHTKPVTLFLSISSEKNYRAMCKMLEPFVGKVILFSAHAERSIKPDLLCKTWRHYLPAGKIFILNNSDQLSAILTPNDKIILVTGSLYAVAALKNTFYVA